MKKDFERMTGIEKKQLPAILLLMLYLWILFPLQLITLGKRMTWLRFAGLLLLGFLLSVVLVNYLYKFANGLVFEKMPKQPWIYGLVAAVVVFLFYAVYFWGQYPGGMSGDTLDQFSQAVGDGPYSDWHPALHTWLFFTLPLWIGKQFSFLVFLQILHFSVATGYLVYVMAKNGLGRGGTAFFLAYICINPFLIVYFMYPWKDMALAIFSVWLVACYIEIVCSKGAWLGKIPHLAGFALSLVLGTYMRHNAILFTLPLFVLVLFYVRKDKKTKYILLASVLALYFAVRLLYSILHVEKPGARVLETVGLPATIWCNVMKKNPGALPPETRAFMYTLASPESYENAYWTGDFNGIKFSGKINTGRINQMSYGKVVNYTLQCFRYAPVQSVEALARLTDLVWGIDGRYATIGTTVMDNNYGIEANHHGWAEGIVDFEKFLFEGRPWRIFFGSFGAMMLGLFFVAVLLLVEKRKSILHILPLFFHNFGTMLLLSGPDYRFFILTTVVWIPLVFVMIKDRA